MKKFEYKVEHFKNSHQHILKELGEKGWELVSAISREYFQDFVLYFKREVVNKDETK